MSNIFSIDLAVSKERISEEGLLLADRLLTLEDIEEKQDDWLDLNRRLVDLLTDSHLRLSYATFTDAAEKINPYFTIHADWIKWRRKFLESLLNPSQVTVGTAPAAAPLSKITGADSDAATANTWALRDAYKSDGWRREYSGHWVIVYDGKVSAEKYNDYEDALGTAMDKYGMLGEFICPYISPVYCHYKMKIYEDQKSFAQSIRDL
jgi:hypothetical protein